MTCLAQAGRQTRWKNRPIAPNADLTRPRLRALDWSGPAPPGPDPPGPDLPGPDLPGPDLPGSDPAWSSGVEPSISVVVLASSDVAATSESVLSAGLTTAVAVEPGASAVIWASS